MGVIVAVLVQSVVESSVDFTTYIPNSEVKSRHVPGDTLKATARGNASKPHPSCITTVAFTSPILRTSSLPCRHQHSHSKTGRTVKDTMALNLVLAAFLLTSMDVTGYQGATGNIFAIPNKGEIVNCGLRCIDNYLRFSVMGISDDVCKARLKSCARECRREADRAEKEKDSEKDGHTDDQESSWLNR
ncbi:hypothetical protein LSAT2_001678 [Lamellibrachia satsuma]|nr:hypothetical protein LSAT2_001678 [Lamellibrachia satsuma]